MILKPVEISKRRSSLRSSSLSAQTIRMKIPLQGYGTHCQSSTCFRAVKVPHLIEQSVLVVHQSIDCIRGAMCLRIIIGEQKITTPAAQLQDCFKQDTLLQITQSPLAKSAHSLSKFSFIFCFIAMPGPLFDKLAQLSTIATFYLHKR